MIALLFLLSLSSSLVERTTSISIIGIVGVEGFSITSHNIRHITTKTTPLFGNTLGTSRSTTNLWKRMDTLTFAGFQNKNQKNKKVQQYHKNHNHNHQHNNMATVSRAIAATTTTAIDNASSSSTTSIHFGVLGHLGLLLVSTVLVTALKKTLIAPSTEEQQGGILDRCPWPFIFFHDVKQGMKDTPTWITVTWVVLWRLLKFVGRRAKQTVV